LPSSAWAARIAAINGTESESTFKLKHKTRIGAKSSRAVPAGRVLAEPVM
jgi:hypothetical protein